MISVQEEVIFKGMSKSKNIALKTMAVSLQILEAILEKAKENWDNADLKKDGGRVSVATLEKIVNMGKNNGDKPRQVMIPDEEFAAFEKHLKTQNVLYAVMDISDDNCKQIVYPSSYHEKMINAVTMFQAERNLTTEVPPVAFIKNYTENDISRINNLSIADVELFRHYAKEEAAKNPNANFPFTVIPNPKTGLFSIIYCSEQKNLAQNCLFRAAWDLGGEQGDIIREQIEIKFSNKQEINIAIDKAEREFCIVDAQKPSNYIKVSAEDFAYYKNNKEVTTLTKLAPDYTQSLYNTLKGLQEPILIPYDEFEKGEKNIEKIINQKTAMFPDNYDSQQAVTYQNLIAQIFGGDHSVIDMRGYNNNYKHSFDTLIPTSYRKSVKSAPAFSQIVDKEIPLDSIAAKDAAALEYQKVVDYYDQFKQTNVPIHSKERNNLESLIVKANKEREQRKNNSKSKDKDKNKDNDKEQDNQI